MMTRFLRYWEDPYTSLTKQSKKKCQSLYPGSGVVLDCIDY